MMFDYPNYEVTADSIWTGRNDGSSRDKMRWHQAMEIVDLRQPIDFSNSIVFIGFCCDEGVGRNRGRIGAKNSPLAFRHALANLPIHFSESILLKDAGNIYCESEDLENAQFVLGEAIAKVIATGGFPIVLGGGHEVTYGHYQGLRKAAKGEKIGVINIDAHLDIREVVEGKGNSGTGFYEIARDCEDGNTTFHYLAIGIQEISNTKALFDYAALKEVKIILNSAICTNKIKHIQSIITDFAKQVDHIYLTIDMDAFAAPYAPGVSALAYNGIVPDANFFSIFSTIINLSNLRTVDIAELNPMYDIDHRTARLGASLLFRLVNEISSF